ncbi:uncharacterized protein LOC133546811 isoform X3 [Nerophis ophidion]|uniref:uncharacterized protein LOC133546811 isoform X3 n=1 Tax=Nerophis ophidion TaxID=159077 RepID=UPI002AE015F0|nr:uncharacterized protein LOC133546811 isoform X3 [Nerophis ophidion]
MSTLQMLRALVDQRLTAAVEEIFVVLERTIAEYEAELSRTKEDNYQLLDAVFKKHQVVLHRTDLDEEHLPHEQEKEPQSPHIHKEEEGRGGRRRLSQLQSGKRRGTPRTSRHLIAGACLWKWEEAGVSGGNPRIHGENMQTLHRKILSLELNPGLQDLRIVRQTH